MAIDGGRLDAQDLMLHLARTLPAPNRAAPLFLFAWKSWRNGNGALAGIAAERALQPSRLAAHSDTPPRNPHRCCARLSKASPLRRPWSPADTAT